MLPHQPSQQHNDGMIVRRLEDQPPLLLRMTSLFQHPQQAQLLKSRAPREISPTCTLPMLPHHPSQQHNDGMIVRRLADQPPYQHPRQQAQLLSPRTFFK
jgi:hypothetical protein